MIKFLFKGILRDKSRSLLPIIIILLGVTLTLLLSGFLRGMMGDIVDQNARWPVSISNRITPPANTSERSPASRRSTYSGAM